MVASRSATSIGAQRTVVVAKRTVQTPLGGPAPFARRNAVGRPERPVEAGRVGPAPPRADRAHWVAVQPRVLQILATPFEPPGADPLGNGPAFTLKEFVQVMH